MGDSILEYTVGAKGRFAALFLMGIFMFIFMITPSARAQSSASISGTVQDSTGATLPGATVTITGIETQSKRIVTTNSTGAYQVLSLPVGGYEIKAEKAGFRAEERTGINLLVGQQAVVNMTLGVGEVSQVVTVNGEGSMVNTTTDSVAGIVGQQEIKDLPLNGRSYDNLITLNPGSLNYTAMTSTTASGNGSGNYFSVDGRYPFENLFLLNGVEYTGMSNTQITPGGVSGQLLGVDAVREFNVLSGTYNAKYGGRAGSQVLIVTQSGSNQLHGSIFEFLRNSALDARNYYDKNGVPPFKRNNFGGALGGPLRKDKTFIFGNYEGLRQILGLSVVAVVPDDNARTGKLPCGIITPLPSGCAGKGDTTPMVVPNFESGMLPLMAYWPVANGSALGGGLSEAFANPEQRIREDFGTLRVDQNFSNRDTLSGVYTIDDGHNLSPISNPVFGTVFTLREQVASLEELHIFSPTTLNTFTAGFSRGAFLSQGIILPPYQFPADLTWVAGHPPGTLSIGSGATQSSSSIANGGSNGIFDLRRNLFTYRDDFQTIKGKQHISVGVRLQRVQSNEEGSVRGNGTASFTNLEAFLQGTASSFIAAPSAIPLYWRTLEGAEYVDDQIQLRRNLMIDVGLRHEFTTGWNEAHGHASNYHYTDGILDTTPVVGNSIFSVNNAKLLFGPRVGLAWDVFGNGKTALHSGFGIHYDLQDNLGFQFEAQPPFTGAAAFDNVQVLSVIPLSSTSPLPPSCGPGVPKPCTTYSPEGVQPDMKTPTVEAWNLKLEQKITNSVALSVGYVGSHAYHLIVLEDMNSIPPQVCASAAGCISGGVGKTTGVVPMGAEYIPVGTRPNPYLAAGSFWQSQGLASYNALQVDLKTRTTDGLRFRANYTWAKSMDTGSNFVGVAQQNEPSIVMNRFDIRQDWGRSGQDIAQQASGDFSYLLPFGKGKLFFNKTSGIPDKLVSGWQVNGIVTLLSGFPITPQDGSSRSGDGNTKNPDRPNMNPSFTGKLIEGSHTQWFNPNAYVLQTVGTYGNAARGSITGPGLAEFNFSAFKNTRISKRINTQFRFEAFNILNRTNFGLPNPTVFAGTNVNPTAGLITSTTTTSRQLQFGLKIFF